MTDILQDLLRLEIEEHTLDFRDQPLYTVSLDRRHQLYKKIESSLGFRFLDALTNVESDVSDIERLACFRHGYHLAGRFLLEMLSTRP